MGLACCKDEPTTTTQTAIRRSSSSSRQKKATPVEKQPTKTTSTEDPKQPQPNSSVGQTSPVVAESSSSSPPHKDDDNHQKQSPKIEYEITRQINPSPKVEDLSSSEDESPSKSESPRVDETPQQGTVQPEEEQQQQQQQQQPQEVPLLPVEPAKTQPQEGESSKVEPQEEKKSLCSNSSSEDEVPPVHQPSSSEPHQEEVQQSGHSESKEQPSTSQPSIKEEDSSDEEKDVPPPLPTSPPPLDSDEEDHLVTSSGSKPFPEIKSKHSLVAKYVNKDVWEKLSCLKTATSGFTLGQAIACAVEFDNQHCGIYAGDWDSYKDFKDVFDPIIKEYHGIASDSKHTSDMDVNKLKGNINPKVPVHSVRIRVGRNIDGFGLSPGITKDQRLGVETLMKSAFQSLKGDLAGSYFPLTGMEEKVRQQLVDDHFLFMSGDPNLQVAGMERDWPEGRGIYHNKEKTFLVWVNEEDQLRIISMQKGGDVRGVFERLARGIEAVGYSVKAESGKNFAFDEKYGFIHSCPTNLGTGMRASVHIDLPGWTKEGPDALKKRCEELKLQPRGTRGESGGQTGVTYDISNKHRLGYSEVELVQCMIDGVNAIYEEDVKLQKKHGL